MDGYLPINLFAERIGKSKQSIYQRLNKEDNPLKQYTREVDGKIYISVEALSKVYKIETAQENESQPDFQPIQSDFQGSQAENKPSQASEQPEIKPIQPEFQGEQSTIQPPNADLVNFLMEQIAQKDEREKRLNEIIAEKDKQLREQSAELAELAKQLANIANNALFTTAQTQYISAKSTTEAPQTEEFPEDEIIPPKEEQSGQPPQKSLFRKIIDFFS